MIDIKRLGGFADEAADKIEGQVEALKELGWSNIELRAVDKKQLADLTESEFDHTLECLEENNIKVFSLGSNIANWGQSILSPFEDTKTLLEKTLKRAVRLKAEYIRIMSYSILTDSNKRVLANQMETERFKRMNYIVSSCLDAGIVPVHENCFTYGGLSYEHTLRLLDNVKGLRLVFDTGNPPIDIDVRSGYPYSYQNSYEFYQNVKEFISHVHIKDSYVTEDKAEHYTYPGEGKGDVLRIVEDLEKSGYKGYYSMEPHMAVVFHNSHISSTESVRHDNFVTYGKKFIELTNQIH